MAMSGSPCEKRVKVAAKNYGYPPGNRQQEAGALHPMTTREWTLPKIQLSLEADSFLNEPPGEKAAQMTPSWGDPEQRTQLSQALTHRSMYSFKLLNLWSFYMNTLPHSWPFPNFNKNSYEITQKRLDTIWESVYFWNLEGPAPWTEPVPCQLFWTLNKGQMVSFPP